MNATKVKNPNETAKIKSGKMNNLYIIWCKLLPKCAQIHPTQTKRGR